MSIIFKEKQYDFILILFKKTSFILVILLIILLGFNFYILFNNKSLDAELNSLKSEKLKLNKLIKSSKEKNMKSLETVNFNLLTKISKYTEKIQLEIITKKDNLLYLNAVTNSQSNIFKFIEKLNKDYLFKDVKLLNLKQSNNLNFELEILLSNKFNW